MARMAAPGRHRFVVPPPDDRNTLTIVGLKAFEIDEAGHGFGGLKHLLRHFRIVRAGLVREAGSEQDNKHNRFFHKSGYAAAPPKSSRRAISRRMVREPIYKTNAGQCRWSGSPAWLAGVP